MLRALPARHVVVLHQSLPADASAADADVLEQARAVAGALAERGHAVETWQCTLDLAALRRRLTQARPDAVFNLVESLGESDSLAHFAPALVESLGIPCTGAPALALALTNDKLAAKTQLRRLGLPTPDWRGPGETGGARSLAPPYILKAVGEHASLGIDDQAVVQDEGAVSLDERIARHARRLGRPCFAEAFVAGREFNLSLLADGAGVETLPPAEIDFADFPAGKPRIVGYAAKWSAGSFEFERTPRRFQFSAADRPLLQELQSLARECWLGFGLRGYARVDFRVDEAGRPWILEVNANPCLSPDAGFAAALAEAGIPFAAACERILLDAGRQDAAV